MPYCIVNQKTNYIQTFSMSSVFCQIQIMYQNNIGAYDAKTIFRIGV